MVRQQSSSIITPEWEYSLQYVYVFTNVTTSAYQDQLNAGFSKVCEIFKVHSKESLKYVREFHTCLLLWWHFHAFPSSTLNETNCDWLFDMSVKRPHGGPWPINAAIYSRPSAVSLKVWLRETNEDINPMSPLFKTFINHTEWVFWGKVEMHSLLWGLSLGVGQQHIQFVQYKNRYAYGMSPLFTKTNINKQTVSTYHCSFQKKWTTRGSKNSDAFYSFTHKFTEFWLIKHNFRTITGRISCYDFKTILICWEIWKLMLLNVSITHIQLHIHGFS